jgi:hypothetical protein
MQNQANNSNSRLFIGMLIGSVAGMALGAIITNLISRIFGKVWAKGVQRNQPQQVDPRWLLQ